MPKQCVLCDEVISEKNMTAEHIIPNAIGGRKKVSGFICRDCNSRTGTEWDANLVGHPMLRFLSLTVKRQKGKVKPFQFTSDGEEYAFDSKGIKLITPVRKLETSTEKVHRFHISSDDKEENQRKFEALSEKYRQRYGRDKVRASIENRSEISDFGFTLDTNGLRDEPTSKAVVKTMLATVFDAGINPRVCDIGLGYLRGERSLSEEELAFRLLGADTQGSSGLRILSQIMPSFHCVIVEGDPSSSVVIGYVILFGCFLYHATLSRAYSGYRFIHNYCVCPETGKSLREVLTALAPTWARTRLGVGAAARGRGAGAT